MAINEKRKTVKKFPKLFFNYNRFKMVENIFQNDNNVPKPFIFLKLGDLFIPNSNRCNEIFNCIKL